MDWITNPEAWLALLTLTVLEIVLGIDNIIFISLLVARLPKEMQESARRTGLFLAMFLRVALLLSLSWIMRLTEPLFTIPFIHHTVSGRDLILLSGGLFLLYKATREIHHKLEGEDEMEANAGEKVTFASAITQIALLDIVFSLDSVITAVGMASHVGVMIIAVIIAVAVMMLAAPKIGQFVEDHPTVKMLALSFLLLVGFSLVVEGGHGHIEKAYIYFAMGFSVFVEMLNLRQAKKRAPVKLHTNYEDEMAAQDDLPSGSV